MRIKAEIDRKNETRSVATHLKDLTKKSYCGIHNQKRMKAKRKQ